MYYYYLIISDNALIRSKNFFIFESIMIYCTRWQQIVCMSHVRVCVYVFLLKFPKWQRSNKKSKRYEQSCSVWIDMNEENEPK